MGRCKRAKRLTGNGHPATQAELDFLRFAKHHDEWLRRLVRRVINEGGSNFLPRRPAVAPGFWVLALTVKDIVTELSFMEMALLKSLLPTKHPSGWRYLAEQFPWCLEAWGLSVEQVDRQSATAAKAHLTLCVAVLQEVMAGQRTRGIARETEALLRSTA